jgi:hypothetical protein
MFLQKRNKIKNQKLCSVPIIPLGTLGSTMDFQKIFVTSRKEEKCCENHHNHENPKNATS